MKYNILSEENRRFACVECRFFVSLYLEIEREMSSKDQEILRLQAELARLQAECTMLEELNRKREEELKQLEAAKSKITTLETAGQKMQDKIDHMQSVIDSLQNMMAWFRKKMFGSMSEKNLPLDPSVLEPTLFDMSLSEEEQAAIDAEDDKWN